MSNPHEVHIEAIKNALTDIEFYVDTEMVGEDARHVCEDVKGALRQIARLPYGCIVKTPEDIRPLADRIAAIRCQLNILTNNLNICLASMDTAETHLASIESALTPPEQNDL